MDGVLLLLSSSNFGALDITIQRQVYNEFYKLVYRVIFYSVKDHSATEDIIQDAFLKVVLKIPVVENEIQLKGWIKVVVRNTTFNYIRKNKKNRNFADSDSVFPYDNLNFSTDTDMIENEVEIKAMKEAIGDLMQQLKPEYRILIEMRWVQNLSYKEIAKELQLEVETVKYRLHRAREKIKKRFIKEWGDKYEEG